jgi:hypothetical protein
MGPSRHDHRICSEDPDTVLIALPRLFHRQPQTAAPIKKHSAILTFLSHSPKGFSCPNASKTVSDPKIIV